MGEPTEWVVLEGGPYDSGGRESPYLGRGSRLHFGTRVETEAWLLANGMIHLIPAAATVVLDVPVTYADSGRRTADGRRVFVVEGGG